MDAALIASMRDRARLDATGCRRRLQALIAHGWALPQICRATGGRVKVDQLRGWLVADQIASQSARTVLEVFDALCFTPPPSDTPLQRTISARARKTARERGWYPFLAWEDIDTDAYPPTVERDSSFVDPIAVELALEGHPVKLTPAEREECVRILHGYRFSDPLIAQRIGCTDRTVLRIRERLGLHGWAKGEQTRMRGAA